MQLFCQSKRFLGCSSLLELYKWRPVASGGAPGDNLVSLWGVIACFLFFPNSRNETVGCFKWLKKDHSRASQGFAAPGAKIDQKCKMVAKMLEKTHTLYPKPDYRRPK